MSTTTRMRLVFCLTLIFAAAGCNQQPAPFEVKDRSPKADRDAPFDPPNTYPEWAYDSEKYVKPVEDLKPEPRVRPGDPLHYFTNKKIIMVRAPSGYTPEEIPRVAIWWTDDNGFHWNKGGYFGRQQEFFPFEVLEDGDYGIRFVGPGQATADQVPPTPERVYHVDTSIPEVTVKIEPEQSWYHVGDTVTIRWQAADSHLIEKPVRVGIFADFAAEQRELVEIQRDLADEGSITYTIPPAALDHELRFRVDATDRARNLGTGVSYALQVVSEAQTEKGEARKTDESSAKEHKEKTSASSRKYSDGGSSSVDPECDIVGETPVALPLGPDDADNQETDDLLSWDGPFFAAPQNEETKARENKAEAWYQKALAKIIDLPPPGSEETKPVPEPVEPPADEVTQIAPPAMESALADAQPDQNNEAASPTDEDTVQTAEATSPPDEDMAQTAEATPPAADEMPQVAAATAEPEATPMNEPETLAAVPQPPVFALNAPETSGSADSVAPDGEPGLSRGLVAVIDPTRGNGLLVPLPATIEAQSAETRLATAHPWRILGGTLDRPAQSVWAMPKPRFALDLYRTVEGRFLADNAALRPASPPGGADHAFAGGVDSSVREPQTDN